MLHEILLKVVQSEKDADVMRFATGNVAARIFFFCYRRRLDAAYYMQRVFVIINNNILVVFKDADVDVMRFATEAARIFFCFFSFISLSRLIIWLPIGESARSFFVSLLFI